MAIGDLPIVEMMKQRMQWLTARQQVLAQNVANADTPGYIGALGTKLGDLGVNIATFALGRSVKDGEAIALIGVDQELSEATLTEIRALPQVKQAKALKF
jgi:D-3-phosphoglycerate dehydrogenase